MKPKVVIVGAGLGGCFLAEGLVDKFDVTMVEISNKFPLLRNRVVDVAHPAITYPHIESGFGGTTKVWHNALMEIDKRIFDNKWPFSKEILSPYYGRAYFLLSKTSREHINQFSNSLKEKLKGIGFPNSLLSQSMFIPRARINAWNALSLQSKVKTIEGEVIDLISNGKDSITKIQVRKLDGSVFFMEADYYVLSAGGLGTPLLLQKLANSISLRSLRNAGKNYEDHPSAFVGEIELNKPLYKLWDFPAKTKSGIANVRIPFSIYLNNLSISFQLRPAYHLKLSKPKEKIINTLNDVRNFPFNPTNYWRLLTQLDDIFSILSFKFGLRIPTRNYTILMIAEQHPTSYRAVWRIEGNSEIQRRWEIDSNYIEDLKKAISLFLKALKPNIKHSRLFSNWPTQIFSSSHHSGTARLSKSAKEGVCDLNGQVHGLSNLFVSDASLIPASGFVNTGLTIAALAIRMGEYLSSLIINK